MAKDPAFLFYSDNFQSGTQFFTDEQTGKYIRLLCAQHLHGHLQEKHMLQICKAYDKDIWEKFKKDEAGNYFNERLDLEVEKRRKFSKSRRDNALHTKKSKKNTEAYAKHMGNGNEIGNEVENKTVIVNIDRRKNDFLTNQKWKEEFCMAKNIQMPELENLQKQFISDCDLKGQYVDSYKKYFTNWFNKNQQNGIHKQVPGNAKKGGTSTDRIEALRNW